LWEAALGIPVCWGAGGWKGGGGVRLAGYGTSIVSVSPMWPGFSLGGVKAQAQCIESGHLSEAAVLPGCMGLFVDSNPHQSALCNVCVSWSPFAVNTVCREFGYQIRTLLCSQWMAFTTGAHLQLSLWCVPQGAILMSDVFKCNPSPYTGRSRYRVGGGMHCETPWISLAQLKPLNMPVTDWLPRMSTTSTFELHL
jgi:hypothetical protein